MVEPEPHHNEGVGRRAVLKGVCAALIGASAAPLLAAIPRSFFERTGMPIGLQLYTLGDAAGRDLDATFGAVAQIGYREIELPNLLGHQPADIAAAAARAGLTIASVHLPLVAGGAGGLTLGSEAQRIADTLGALRTNCAIAPIAMLPSTMRPAPGETMSAALARAFVAAGTDIWKRSAALLNGQAQALKPTGIIVAYHNHNVEFAPIGNTTGWKILAQELDPKLVKFEVDIGWVAAAGLDPVRFLDSVKGRVSHLHIKDLTADSTVNYAIAMKPAEVGAGVQPWTRILPAAYRAGARHFLVEQEPPFTIPRMEAARRSFAFLQTLRA